MITGITVLYDADCPTCVRARTWLEHQVQLVALTFVAAGSDEARRRFPTLDHARSLREVTAVANTGAVFHKDNAWIVLLWSLARWRDVADHMASPIRRPFVRAGVGMVNGWRLFHQRRRAAGLYGGGHGPSRQLPPPIPLVRTPHVCQPGDRCGR
jgi:predicted DCC family thiol-disulfide oxidoreductase YuxK